MFLTLLVVTFVISLTVSFLVVQLFRSAIGNILERILSDPISVAWVRYLPLRHLRGGHLRRRAYLGSREVHQPQSASQ